MTFIDRLGVTDFRHQLERVPERVIGRRSRPPINATLHYEGVTVSVFGNPAAEKRLLQSDARYHIQKNWGTAQRPAYGNGLMYHLNVLSNGEILLTRDLDEHLWHCRNSTGNANSISIHLPLGGSQKPTAAQWHRACELFDALIEDYGWSGRDAIVGHCEWPYGRGNPVVRPVYRPLPQQSLCPGRVVFDLLAAYRAGERPATRGYEVEVIATAGLNIRAGRGTEHPRVGALEYGERVQVVGSETGWLELADGRGFVAEQWTRRVD